MNIKNKIITIFISIFLALGVFAPQCSFANPLSKPVSVLHNLVPQKAETGIVLKKFLKSMLLVASSCAVIFLILLAYKRAKSQKKHKREDTDISKNLNSPETVEEATKFFIEKF